MTIEHSMTLLIVTLSLSCTKPTDEGDGSGVDINSSGDSGIADSDTGRGSSGEAPIVYAEPIYEDEIEVTTHTYGQGQVHTEWMGPVDSVVNLVLDLYEPIEAPAGRPAAVVIHGGGFRGGSRSNKNSVDFATHFASRGFVTVSIDYRIVDHQGTVPQAWFDIVREQELSTLDHQQGLAMYTAARDAKAALRWLNANADTYGIDTDYITTIGGSAGSHLAIMLGVTNPADFRDEITVDEDPTLTSTNLDADADVHTIIDHWGGITHMEILQAIDGQSRFDTSDAPVSIVHGTEDTTVPFEEAQKLRDEYIGTGVHHAYHPIEGGGHTNWSAIIDGMNLRELAFEFVVEQQNLVVTPAE